MITTVAFRDYRRTLETVSEFKYLGGVLTTSYDNWLVVVANLSKAYRGWTRLSGILGIEW